ncbi:MAG: hypothetical protein K5795_05040 [Lachnospiraceae bacterium]|nr:hypothetical protein [Lachnospiraceae bacterium]
MLTAVLLVLMILGLYSLFVFGYGGFWTVLIIVVSISGIVLKLLLKKLPGKIINVILLVFIVVGAFSVTRLEAAEPEISIYDYTYDVIDVEEQVIYGKSKADSSLKKLEKKYGENDTTIMLHAYLEALDGNMEEAYALMDSCKRKTTIEYYSRMNSLLMLDLNMDNDTRDSKLYKMYLEAAEYQPYWDRGQQMAGILLFENKEYDRAIYYLQWAYTLNEEDTDTLYYLGALFYEIGDQEAALYYFKEALDYDASEAIKSGIAWYLDQMRKEEVDGEL